MKSAWSRPSLVLFLALASLSAVAAIGFIPNLQPFADKTGAVATFNTAGDIHEQGAFFQSLGTNGRTCATCHQADQAFSISAKGVREVYERTHGSDPLFAAVDVVRAPLIGVAPYPYSWVTLISVTVIGWAGTFAFFARFRQRIAYWV